MPWVNPDLAFLALLALPTPLLLYGQQQKLQLDKTYSRNNIMISKWLYQLDSSVFLFLASFPCISRVHVIWIFYTVLRRLKITGYLRKKSSISMTACRGLNVRLK